MNFKTEKKIDLQHLCRSCLGENLIIINIFKTVDHQHKIKLCELYRECTANLNVQENDGMPPNICYDCLEKMRVAYQFLRQCHSSEAQLRKRLMRSGVIAKDNQANSFNIDQLVHLDDFIKEEPIDSNVTAPIEENFEEHHSSIENEGTSVGSDLDISEVSQPTEIEYAFINCNERFENAEEYDQQKCEDNISTPFLCSVCDKYFKTRRKLESHSLTHSPTRNYKCNLCDKAFYRNDLLRSHQRVHTGEKPYECKVCGKKFTQSSILKTHTALHTGKTVACRICNKMFSRRSMLIVHNREHTGEKPYACGECPKRFFQQCHLTVHKLSHSDHKQFKCEICGKEYTEKRGLNFHMYKHTGKLFKCFKCTTGFNKKDQYRSHLMVRHGIEWSGVQEDLIELELEQGKIM